MDVAQAQTKKFQQMTEAPIPSLIGRLAVPTIISMLVSSFYNMADTFFVGKLGKSATAAVGVVFALMAVIQAIGFLFGNGSGNYISRLLGAQDSKGASRAASVGFFSALFAGGVVMALGLIFLRPMVRMLGATPTIEPFAQDYARLILLGAPYMMASLVLNNQLRFQGSAFYGMLGITSGAALNIGLDPLFIFVFHMGISGAALATILSQLVSFLILLAGCRHGGNLRIRWRNFKPKLRLYWEIFRGGLPSLCRQGLSSVAVICLNNAAIPYGDAAIAAMSVVSRITMFASSALLGFGQGFQPVCGFNYGARRFGRVHDAFWFCIKVSVGFLVVVALAGVFLAPRLVAVFQPDPEVVRIGGLALMLQCLTFPLAAWVIVVNMMLQTIAKTLQASILSVARQGLFFLPCILLLPLSMGVLGIQVCQPIADTLSFVLATFLGMTELRELRRLEAAERSIPQTETTASRDA